METGVGAVTQLSDKHYSIVALTILCKTEFPEQTTIACNGYTKYTKFFQSMLPKASRLFTSSVSFFFSLTFYFFMLSVTVLVS